jgi:hypothetical protein
MLLPSLFQAIDFDGSLGAHHGTQRAAGAILLGADLDGVIAKAVEFLGGSQIVFGALITAQPASLTAITIDDYSDHSKNPCVRITK